MQHVMAFQNITTKFLAREGKKENQSKVNGDSVKKEPASESKLNTTRPGKTVLTLFGSAPTPRQLFSSFQHSSTIAQRSSVKADGVDLELEELGLPNNINATKVMPLDPDTVRASSTRSKEPTFADVFPPPATLPQLNPPKPKSTNRSASISWTTGDALLPKPSRKNAYTMQPLNVGAWIDYGGRDADRESSGAIKRRRRESVISAAPVPKPVEDMTPAEIIAQEEALFKAAYGSFAPSVDNSKAIVPEEIRDRVWWHKVGERRFDKRFVLDPALDDSFPSPLYDEEAIADDSVTLGGTDELREFEEAVENFDEAAFKAESLVSTIKDEERSVEEMLEDISGLLETLSSYQRIRNSYIVAAPSRNPTSPSPLLAAAVGTPSEPTKEEIATYKSLRSQLAQMISKLPPYAVAKLDGEQLEDLTVSKTIIVEGKEFKGTMEEDQLTRMIRSSAIQAAANPPTAARPSTEYRSTAASYARTPSVSTQPPRSAHAPNGTYYNSTRTPATSYNRSTAAQSYATPSANSQRQSFTQSAYTNTVNRPPSYGQTNGQTGYRPGFGYGSTFNAQATLGQPPAQTPAAYNTQQSQFRNPTAFNQNAALATPSYNAQQAAQARQGYGAAATQFVQQRPNGQPQQNSQQQSNSGRATPTFAPPQTPSALGPSGFHTSMTTEAQQMMMERQRAQLAQQPLARQQAQASATPQPPQQQQSQPQQPNGDGGRGASGTPMVA